MSQKCCMLNVATCVNWLYELNIYDMTSRTRVLRISWSYPYVISTSLPLPHRHVVPFVIRPGYHISTSSRQVAQLICCWLQYSFGDSTPPGSCPISSRKRGSCVIFQNSPKWRGLANWSDLHKKGKQGQNLWLHTWIHLAHEETSSCLQLLPSLHQ